MSHEPPLPAATTLLTHSTWVRRLAQSLLTGTDGAIDADDVAQQAWSAALSRPPSHAERLRGWWRTVLANSARKLVRSELRRRRHETAAFHAAAAIGSNHALSAADTVARGELHRRLVEAVLALPEPSRSVLLLRFFDDLPPRAIARQLGLPVETVRTRIKRGLEQLRDHLTDDSGADRRARLAAFAPLLGPTLMTGTKWSLAAAATLLLAIGSWQLVDDREPPATSSPIESASSHPASGSADPSSPAPDARRDADARGPATTSPTSSPEGAARRGETLHGHVVDEAGHAVEGAAVFLFRSLGGEGFDRLVANLRRLAAADLAGLGAVRRALSDRAGAFEFTAVEGLDAARIEQFLAAFHPTAGTLGEGWCPLERDLTLRLGRTLAFSVRVVERSGLPAPDATVRLMFGVNSGTGGSFYDVTQRVDARGETTFELPPASSLWIGASSPELRTVPDLADIPLPRETGAAPIQLVLQPIHRSVVKGRLALPDGGSAGAWLRATLDLDELSLPPPKGVGVVCTTASHDSGAVMATDLLALGTIDLVGDRFEIEVEPRSAPIAVIARQTLLGWIERGSDGEFADAPCLTIEPWRLPSSRARGRLRLRPIDESGDAIDLAACRVTLDAPDREWSQVLATISLGSRLPIDGDALLLEDLPLGRWTVSVAANGRAAGTASARLDGEHPEATIDVVLARGDRTVRGVVRGIPDFEGDCALVAYSLDDADRWQPLACGLFLDERFGGRFELPQLPRGRVALVARVRRMAPAWQVIDLTEGDADVELVPPAGRPVDLIGRTEPSSEPTMQLMARACVRDADGRAVYDQNHPAAPSSQGRASVHVRLPAGRYTVTLDVVDHEPGSVEFEVPPLEPGIASERPLVVRVPLRRRVR